MYFCSVPRGVSVWRGGLAGRLTRPSNPHASSAWLLSPIHTVQPPDPSCGSSAAQQHGLHRTVHSLARPEATGRTRSAGDGGGNGLRGRGRGSGPPTLLTPPRSATSGSQPGSGRAVRRGEAAPGGGGRPAFGGGGRLRAGGGGGRLPGYSSRTWNAVASMSLSCSAAAKSDHSEKASGGGLK